MFLRADRIARLFTPANMTQGSGEAWESGAKMMLSSNAQKLSDDMTGWEITLSEVSLEAISSQD